MLIPKVRQEGAINSIKTSQKRVGIECLKESIKTKESMQQYESSLHVGMTMITEEEKTKKKKRSIYLIIAN